ncbi:MAG TPA: histidine triad nucleotide-binding protein [Gemmatimonadaceae bacterium]|nr:histidine triad nucleotide-binding protein [Gemmatimonadaceae bacterium]
MSETCLFCRIVRGEIPATIVSSTDEAVAIRDIDPKAPVHVLVLPRKHLSSLNDAADPALLGRLVALGREVARSEGIADTGYRLVINTNEHGGQTVNHLHVHVLGGRPMRWPPG